MVALLLSLALVTADDPVPGSMMYVPNIGEHAVLHDYDGEAAFPDVEVWTSTTALAKYLEAFTEGPFQRERTKELEKREWKDSILVKQRETLIKGPKSRGEVLYVADMTPVRVCELATFYKEDRDEDSDGSRFPDNALVEVLSGPMKGRYFWAALFNVRVPGAKGPDLLSGLGFGNAPKPDAPPINRDDSPKQTPEPEPPSLLPAPIAPKPTARLLVEDSSWNRLTDFVQVHCRVRNLTDRAIESITMKVVYLDAAGKMVYSGDAIVGTLKPGEVKTCSTFDKVDARMQRYVFEFEGRDDGERGGIPFTTSLPKATRKKGSR